MTRSHPETDYPCDCHVLDDMADEPDTPVVFDSDTNEYQLIIGERGEGRAVLYYCNFCGGRMPDSRRDRLFARVTRIEIARLQALTQDIRSMDDAVRILGEPDSDIPCGVTVQTPDDGITPVEIRGFRNIEYYGLSETAVVQIADTGKERVAVQFIGKALEDVPPAEPAVRTRNSPALKAQKAGKETLYCDFCGQSEHAVERMLQGFGASICSTCAASFVRSMDF